MTVYLPGPTVFVVRSHSAYGNHQARFHCREWNSVPLVPGNVLGSFTNWLSLPCDGEEMADELVENLTPFYPTTYFIDSVQVVTYDPDDPIAIPRAIKAYGSPGTDVSSGWSKATMQNYILRDSEYHLAKIVLLDTIAPTSWDALTDISGSAEATALVGTFTSDAWAFQSAANLKITTFQKITYKLSDELRKRYGMD